MKLSVILMLAASAVCAAPVVSCRMGLGERGTFRIARDWLLVCGPGEATNDGIPKWTVEVAPALVKTNYTHGGAYVF